MKRLRQVLQISAAVALFALAGGPALAGTISQGADYSYASSNGNPVICDQEADGRTAYVKGALTTDSTFRVNDQDGSSGSCWYKSYSNSVARHVTCEDINNWPDNCSGTSYE